MDPHPPSSSPPQEIPTHWSKFLGLLEGVSFDQVRDTTDDSIDGLLKPWVEEKKITAIERAQITAFWKKLRDSPPSAPAPDYTTRGLPPIQAGPNCSDSSTTANHEKVEIQMVGSLQKRERGFWHMGTMMIWVA